MDRGSFISKDQKVLLKFMEATIEKVNICFSNLYAIEKVLIEKGIVTEKELLSRLKESKDLPKRLLGARTLKEMIEASDKE